VKWYIIRHAEKEPGDFYNPVLGHQDQPISAIGHAQAENLSAYFTDNWLPKFISVNICALRKPSPMSLKK
jgi:broad specificity phosphatase PhoE